MKGKIILVPFPFTDLKTSKRRPALVILDKEKDVIVSFISSKIPTPITDHVILIKNNHLEFNLTGLKINSSIHLDKLATIKKSLILGEIGEIGPILKSEINKHFKKIFHF